MHICCLHALSHRWNLASRRKQQVFRPHHRVEENLVTAGAVGKLLSIDVPVWVVRLDLSQSFDRIDY